MHESYPGVRILPLAHLLLCVVAVIVCCQGCSTRQAAQPPKVVFVAIDKSGSFDYLSAAKNHAASLVDELQPGDVIIVGTITNNSFSDASVISCPRHLPRPTKRHDPALRQRFADTKAEIIEAIERIDDSKCRGTDLWGMLYYASRKLTYEEADIKKILKQQNKPEQVEKYLVVYSDMEDTVNREQRELDLAGATVKALFVSHPEGSITGDESKRAFWRNTLNKSGAKVVSLVDPSDSENLSLILTD